MIEPGAPGVWYSFQSPGATLQATVFGDYDTQILVYSGASCEELACLTGNDVAPFSEGSSEALWEAAEGLHFLLVYGYNSEIGDFELTLQTVEPPANDVCAGAFELQIGDTVEASTALATMDSDVVETSCGDAIGGDQSAPGVWYSVTGSGSTMQAAIAAIYDVQVNVYSGDDCDNLVCVDGTEGEEPNYTRGQVPWDSIAGEPYYILVHGFMGQIGTFEITISEVLRPPNDVCSAATEIQVGVPVDSSTALATLDAVETCGTALGGEESAPGLWYEIMGTGSSLSITVESEYNIQVSIYSGESCDSLICVDGREGEDPELNSATVVWDTLADALYYIHVHGSNNDKGEFDLIVSETSRPENDDCAKATILQVGETASGSTVFASEDGISSFCGDTNNLTAPGVWYTTVGTGRLITASFNTTYDAQLTVYSGDECGSLVCTDGTDGDGPSYTSGSVTWESQSGEAYYLLVHGFNRAVGDFNLSLGASSSVLGDTRGRHKGRRRRRRTTR